MCLTGQALLHHFCQSFGSAFLPSRHIEVAQRPGQRVNCPLLQGLAVCGCCGYAYYGKKVSRSAAKGQVPYAYYRCVGTDAYRFGGKCVCQNKQVRTDKLDLPIWREFSTKK